jgi:hypothetical protein
MEMLVGGFLSQIPSTFRRVRLVHTAHLISQKEVGGLVWVEAANHPNSWSTVNCKLERPTEPEYRLLGERQWVLVLEEDFSTNSGGAHTA